MKPRLHLRDIPFTPRGRVKLPMAKRTTPKTRKPVAVVPRIEHFEPGWRVVISLPIDTVSEANRASHEHWRKRQDRARAQRLAAANAVRLASKAGLGSVLPAVVTITRVASRSLDDDNLASSQKAIRDGIADALGIDDGSDRVLWRYKQERGPVGVRIDIRHRGASIDMALREAAAILAAVGL